MKSIKEEFPNPVLAQGRDDYIEDCSFYSSFEESEIVVDSENIVIPIKYSLQCRGLQELIVSNDARVVVLVKSSAASYSKLFTFEPDKNEMIITVPKFAVVNKMDITSSVIAAHDIKDFSCPGEFNELYFGASTFEIRKGDILATEESRSVYVDNSELERPIASIFNISKRDEQENDVEPSFDDEKIEIYLKSELYDLYYEFKDFNNGVLRRYATGIIVYPVLVEAISYIVGDSDDTDIDYSGKRWYRAIQHKADQAHINLESPEIYNTTIADRLLGGVSLDALKSFKDTLDSEINSGESEMIGGID